MTRTALVTGANRGLGLEIARQLAACGATVVLTGRDAGSAERTANSRCWRVISRPERGFGVSREIGMLAAGLRVFGVALVSCRA